jgi:predicted dithiol-disulfide oxidoreductase (DUF899 family)
MHELRFPGETEAYRRAREALLQAECELRLQMERVAALRRGLPLGGAVPEDYAFQEMTEGGEVVTRRLSELFENGKDTLVLYNLMYGPNMAKACPMCSSFLDGVDGNARHLAQRVNLAVVAKSPIDRIHAYAEARGWQRLRMLSSAKSAFNRDYHGETPEGDQNPMIHVFVRCDGQIHHFWSSELQFLPSEPGQNQRHLDTMWPLWNILDLTPEGRGDDWYPGL